eukprot:COSAG06_NODE_1814_length_8303_cov_3.907972_10_plen_81_part_00
MDDECEECEQDWKKDGTYHFDIWLGPTHMQQNYTRLVGEQTTALSPFICLAFSPSLSWQTIASHINSQKRVLFAQGARMP